MPLPSTSLCTVTAHFVKADGSDMKGVLVRFTPLTATERPQGSSFVSADVTAESDEDGLLSITLIRGMKGYLAVTGIPLFREVTVPNASTANLFDLVADAPDPLEPTTVTVIDLPRRS